MKASFYTPVYALTLLLSAALLFSIQPMFSKMILPLLGGSPQVWNTAMLFFQIMLLGGYAYAHATTRFLSIRAQAILHAVLLALFLVVLPLGIPAGWQPPAASDPTLWQLGIMLATVGGPFFVLAGSAPMLQRWFAATGHKDAHNPYFLYGASNLGSMTALLAYPVVIEPLLTLDSQSEVWSVFYAALILCVIAAGFVTLRGGGKAAARKKTAASKSSWKQRSLWLILSFIPSSLMLGVTTYITTDIAAAPLLWIVPLALYVSTFIIAFARKPAITRKTATVIQGVLIILLIAGMIAALSILQHYFLIKLFLHIAVFFFCALACHMELAEARPAAGNLTEFYLTIALGGALGGFFNAIIAPQFFLIPLEYNLVLISACFMRLAGDQPFALAALRKKASALRKRKLSAPEIFTLACICMVAGAALLSLYSAQITEHGKTDLLLRYTASAIAAMGLAALLKERWSFALAATLAFCLFPIGYSMRPHSGDDTIYRARNFFGVLRVIDDKAQRSLLHGTTTHGTQALVEKYRLTPLSYYSEKSPIRDIFRDIPWQTGKQKVGVLGLGVGVTACFQKNGRSFDYFEIDPDIVAIAEDKNLFTFLSDCGSPYEIILGDGRLKIAEKPDGHYDILLIDAFSSDNIPVHLVTREAVEIYLNKLKPGGVLVFNVSNRYLDLEPVLGEIARSLGVKAYAKADKGGKIGETDIEYFPSHFIAFATERAAARFLEAKGWTPALEREGVKTWTDQYSNILSVFFNASAKKRFEAMEDPPKK